MVRRPFSFQEASDGRSFSFLLQTAVITKKLLFEKENVALGPGGEKSPVLDQSTFSLFLSFMMVWGPNERRNRRKLNWESREILLLSLWCARQPFSLSLSIYGWRRGHHKRKKDTISMASSLDCGQAVKFLFHFQLFIQRMGLDGKSWKKDRNLPGPQDGTSLSSFFPSLSLEKERKKERK